MGSFSVGSSSRARELFTRFDTGQRCRISLAADLSSAVGPSFIMTRSHDFSFSPVARS